MDDLDNGSENIDVIEPTINIEATLAKRLNLADFINAVPVIRELAIANDTDRDAKELDLVISAEPPFLKSKLWRVDAVAAGQRMRIKDCDITLDGQLLGRLTEAENALVTLRLQTREAEPILLAEHSSVLELLPRNQWGGLTSLPDMAAAFVQPNDPAIDKLLKQAAGLLRTSGKEAAINGYGSGTKHAWEITSAIWSAVGALGLDYVLPPASFENLGQKVRSPSQIVDSGIGTCLDLALLFAALLEQAGLNPLLVFTQGHAFVGVWLKSEEFTTSVVDDITALRKRVKLKEMVLFEATLTTQRSSPKFSYAAERGFEQIAESEEHEFELAVDIRRARLQRIKPLSSNEAIANSAAAEMSVVAVPILEDAPELPEDIGQPDTNTMPETPEDRLVRWQRKLLDLSLRNNLLSFKGGKKSLQLDAPEPGQLEDLLAEGHALKLLPRPDLMDGNDPRNQAIHQAREQENVRREHALDALVRKEIFIKCPPNELDTRLVELYRSARASLIENGANTLYLALGFLSWTRSQDDPKRYKAPLILLPVSLERRSARSGFSLKLHDDEARFNPTLIEMLRQDFHLDLKIPEGELPKDDHGLDVAGIWRTVASAIRDIAGWEVVDDAYIAMFSFAKHLMWKDLVERTEQLKQNAVVRHLIETPREPFASEINFLNLRTLDDEVTPQDTFCPLPADSSQLAAVMAAAKGKDFVLIGPPGTGKSQTIANLIAQCLAERKRVLFVSEKMAALDVVYRRMRAIGLGDFCLELHSSKARKTEVLEQLRKSWDAQGECDPDEWRREAVRLGQIRSSLNNYVTRLHRCHLNGLSVFAAIGQVVSGKDFPDLHFQWPSCNEHNAEDLAQLRELAERLDVNAQNVGEDQFIHGPLLAITNTEWTPSWQAKVTETAAAVIKSSEHLLSVGGDYIRALGFPVLQLNRTTRNALAVLARTLPQAYGHDWRFVLRPDAKSIVESLQAGLDFISRHKQNKSALASPWALTVVDHVTEGGQLLRQSRQLKAELSPPWSTESRGRFIAAIGKLRERNKVISELSLKYRAELFDIDAVTLQQEWSVVEKSVWPLGWIRRRALIKKLKSYSDDEGAPNLGQDIKRLVKIHVLKNEVIATAKFHTTADDIWSQLRTDLEAAEAAIEFQRWLSSAAAGDVATLEGALDLVAAGRCGQGIKTDYVRIKDLQKINARLLELAYLGEATDGVWQGYSTDLEAIETAQKLQAVVRAVVSDQPWQLESSSIIDAGGCGSIAQENVKKLREMLRLETEIHSLRPLAEKTAGLWSGLSSNTAELQEAIKFHNSMAAVLTKIATTTDLLIAIRAPIERLLGEGNLLLESSGSVASLGQGFVAGWTHYQNAFSEFAKEALRNSEAEATHNEHAPDELAEICRNISQSAPKLKNWCAWNKARAAAVAVGLVSLVDGIEKRSVAVNSVRKVFEMNYCRWWLNAVVDSDEILLNFVSAEHEKRIRDFNELDKHFTTLTRSWVRAQLCAELPAQDSVSKNSEWGLLCYEMQKKSKHLPLRDLMGRSPTAITTLSPCLLMSPLSVAQYLSPEVANFDIVIFDEASQIPVWDAVGAIARAKQVVMVGDPKQLPPTSFFDRAETDSEDTDVEADLESILDECIGANLPTLKLSWHYRSQHESLIAFSNHRYYEGRLVTFPSPYIEDKAVSFHHVSNGTYEKGGARTNKAEAKALVDDLVGKLNSPECRDKGLTIGVVTFNAEQQRLIEDLLDEERRKTPVLERYFADTELEPVFVKNLESVQGDERDIMYFSLTYGPSISHAVSMNFGPLNRQGGERRLNVAITRARHELRVFSSLRAEQLDLSRTQAEGVRDLKHFMEFAERGAQALGEAVFGSQGDFDSPFEEAVSKALMHKGWRLQSQIGVSAFRIDLGVVDPDAPGSYLAGIECDGATYHRSATARDRDMIREQMLRGLGWNILRIWSTDWWVDADTVVEKIHSQLTVLLEKRRAERVLQSNVVSLQAKREEKIEQINKLPEAEENPPAKQVLYAKADTITSPDVSGFYVEVDFNETNFSVNPDAFFEETYVPTLLSMIELVVSSEAPLRDDVLARRIARAHGWMRTGARIQDRVNQLVHGRYHLAQEDDLTFVWRDASDLQTVRFRAPTFGESRAVEEVATPELITLAREIFASGTQQKPDGMSVMASKLGLQRLRTSSRERLANAWDLAVEGSV